MKKIILGFFMFVLLAGCTSKEQNQQIAEFWNRQVQQVQMKFMKKALKNKSLPADLMAAIDDKNINALANKIDISRGSLPTKSAAPAAKQEPIAAQLFLSDSCGWCKKLKQSGFPSKFKNKYQEDVDLKVYEVHSTEGSREFAKAIKKHNLKGGVPLLIIGDSVIHGYSDNMMALADEKVRIELKKRGPAAPVGPAVVSIAMEGAAIAGPASEQDKEKMKDYLSYIREYNEASLKSVRKMFPGRQVWNQALAIITKTENEMDQLAANSSNYDDFLAKAKALEETQQQQIESLIRQNASKIR